MNGECPSNQWDLIMFDKRITPDILKSYKKSEPFKTAYVTTDDAETALKKVLSSSGAILPLRDPIDDRIVMQVISRLNGNGDIGHIIDDEDEVGGWPEYISIPPLKDDDNDGMPNAWEVKNGLNPNETEDASLDGDKDGYTNIEEFLNGTDPRKANK